MQNDIEDIRQVVRHILSEEETSNISRADVDNEQSPRYEIAKLSPKADNTTIINKINEIINEFNKSLIDNRI